MKQIITQYSDSELTLLFNNDQSLYNDYRRAVRRNDFSIVKDICDEMFEYSPEQLEELESDFNNEVEKYAKG
jgi:hypothetical protein